MFNNQREADEYYMSLALELAAKARGRTSPNPLVGAVIVRDDKIIGQGYHRQAGTDHAEAAALKSAAADVRGATVYVNLEPCSHYGRTPPCAQALINAGVKRVVAAMVDPNPLVAGRGLAMLVEAGIETAVGVRAKEAAKLNEVFIKYITTNRPFVTVKWAMTIDGKIAAVSGDARWITNEASRAFVHRLRDRSDAILVGIGTVLVDNPRLTTRLPEGGGRDPLRVIVDEVLRIPLDAAVLHIDSTEQTLIVTTELAANEKREALQAKGAEVLVLPAKSGKVDLGALMAELGKRAVTSVLIEGGSQINAAALEAGIVDKIYAFIAPKICGGAGAPGPVSGCGVMKINDAWQLRDINITRFAEDILIEGYF